MSALISWARGGEASLLGFDGEQVRLLSTISAAPGTPLLGTLAALPPEASAAPATEAPAAPADLAPSEPASEPPEAASAAASTAPGEAASAAASTAPGEPGSEAPATRKRAAQGEPALGFQVKIHGCKRTAEGFVLTGRVVNLTRALRIRLEKRYDEGSMRALRPALICLLACGLLAGCDDDKYKAMADKAAAPPSATPPPPASRAADFAPARPAAPALPTSSAHLTGTKSLRQRLVGKWEKQVSPAEAASNRAELDKAEAALKAAKTKDEKATARDRKTTIEDVAFSWVEFSKDKRATKAPPNRLVVERPYEVVDEQGATITVRVWDQMNPRGANESYSFKDDNTLLSPRSGGAEGFDTWTRKN